MKNRSPWSWIPSLYFAQGIPYVVAMTVAVVMYKRLGISNADIALYTSWLYLPWVIKPFWSPFVDIIRTKRWWIVTMQLLIGAGFAAVAFLLPLPHFFQSTLAVLWLIAFSSATHDIAADGFYMLALDSGEQSFFVGIRSTFYRLAMIAGQGLLIIVAGALETATGTEPVHLHVSVTPGVELSDARTVAPQPLGPSGDEISLALFPERIYMPDELIPADSLDALRRFVERSNVENGFVPETAVRSSGLPADEGWWERTVSAPLKRSLQSAFGVEKKEDISVMSGNAAVAMLRLDRRPADGERLVFNISMDKGSKDIILLSADRLTSARMDPYSPLLMEHGLRVMIGKGPRSREVAEAVKKYRGLYLQAYGGCGALYASCVTSSRLIAYPELGPEALLELQVHDFPAVCLIDCLPD